MKRLLPVTALAISALALPTNQRAVFNGLPLASWPEIGVLLLLAVLLTIRSSRQALARHLESPKLRKSLLALLVLLFPFKVVVYAAAPTDGAFEVCYRLYDDSDTAACSPTFASSPWLAERSSHFAARSSSTQSIEYRSNQVEGRESFRSSNWDNPTINSLAFDGGWWPWNSGDKNIDVFPFRAEFRAEARFTSSEQLLLRYVGEGVLTLDGVETPLEPSYSVPKEVLLQVDSGTMPISIDFAFKRVQQRDDGSNLPYARLELLNAATGDAIQATKSPWITMANLASDAAILGLILATVVATRRALRLLSAATALAGAIWGVSRILETIVSVDRWPLEPFIILLICATLTVLYLRSQMLLLLPLYLLSSWISVQAETAAAEGNFRGLSQVIVRLRGNDQLVYHAFSQIMLGENWLRGAEDIYHFQPGIRYYFYWLGILFGDSGVLTGLVSASVTGVSILFLFSQIPHSKTLLARLTSGAAVIGLLVWWTSSHTIQSIILGLSEFGTWATMLFMTGLVMRGNSTKLPYIIGTLSAVVTWIRPNQGIAVLAFLTLSCIVTTSSVTERVKHGLRAFGVFLGFLLLIPLHNLYFGSRLVFQPTGAGTASQVAWSTILRAPFDDSARRFILDQFQGLLYLPSVLPDIRSPALALAFPLFAIVFVLAAIVKRREQRSNALIETGLAALVVVGQIAPYLKYGIFRYYPIMLDSIYLSLVAMGVFLLRSPNRLRSDSGEALRTRQP